MPLDERHLPPIVFYSSTDWEGNWGSRQQVVLELENRGFRILYIEQQARLEQYLKNSRLRKTRRILGARCKLRKLGEKNIWLCTPPLGLPAAYYCENIARHNATHVLKKISSAMEEFLAGDTPLVWCYKPEHHYLINTSTNRCVVYHCIDQWITTETGRKKFIVNRMERNLLEKSDVVFANSNLTYQKKKAIKPSTFQIPSGANIEHFSKAITSVKNSRLKNVSKPVLMFAGEINERIDADLVYAVASKKPDWTIVLIGKVWPAFGVLKTQKLKRLGNVVFVGRRGFEELPGWFASADVCLLPYVEDLSTHYRSPLKLYEYLATGKPIISTPHPEVEKFEDFVSISKPEMWIEEINTLLLTDTDFHQNERLVESRKHSWSKRVDEMLKEIERVF